MNFVTFNWTGKNNLIHCINNIVYSNDYYWNLDDFVQILLKIPLNVDRIQGSELTLERDPLPLPRDSSTRKQLMQPMTWHGRSGRASGTCRSTLTPTARTRTALSPALITAPLRRSKPLRGPRVKPLPSPNLRVVSNDVQLRKWCWVTQMHYRIVNMWNITGRKKMLCPFYKFLIIGSYSFR